MRLQGACQPRVVQSFNHFGFKGRSRDAAGGRETASQVQFVFKKAALHESLDRTHTAQALAPDRFNRDKLTVHVVANALPDVPPMFACRLSAVVQSNAYTT